jgi:hypothetical protein
MAWNPAILVFTQDGKRTHGSRSTDGSYSAKKKKKKKKKISQLRNLVTRIHSLRGMKVARPTNGVDGRGCFKKRMLACNGQDRGLCFGPKGR